MSSLLTTVSCIVSTLITLSSGEYYTCALNHVTDPCPPPRWEPTYNLTLSTICQPGHAPNYFIPPPNEPWGFVSIDWTQASSIWANNSTNKSDSTVEATSITGCQLIKNSSNPNTRCMIYHNMEVALQVMESQRKVMYDPTKKDWWLQYTDGNGNKNGTIYNYPLNMNMNFRINKSCFSIDSQIDGFLTCLLRNFKEFLEQSDHGCTVYT